MVAATIVLLVLLALLGTIAYGLQGTQNAAGHQQAIYYARKLMELIRERDLAQNLGFSDAAGARIPLNAAPFATDFPADSGYSRRLLTEQLSADTLDYKSKVYRVDVTVFWEVKGREIHYQLEGLTRAL
jgi:type II secretory pathway pseudopilin PulG